MLYQKTLHIIRAWQEAARAKRAFFRTPELADLYTIFKGHPEGKWIVGKRDALYLYTLVRERQPQRILDLGTGIGASAAVMALAQGAGGTVVSVEQYEKCVRIARELVPEALQARITFVRTDAHAFRVDRLSRYLYLSGYRDLPLQSGPFDFVVVDGPGGWLENGELVTLPNGDIMRLLPHLTPGATVYVDGRKRNVDLYRRYLGNYLRYAATCGSATLFERTAQALRDLAKLKVQDAKLAGRIASEYFS